MSKKVDVRIGNIFEKYASKKTVNGTKVMDIVDFIIASKKVHKLSDSSPCVIESQASITDENIVFWIVRDETGTLCAFNNKPCRQLTSGEWESRGDGGIMLNPEICKSVTWDSKPVKVKLVEVKD